ncbi:uncharacterized protein GIQ15_04612 [Arthroderma uncinatum]|uniref:uncharacterized protein n=1 Tax=Arthroderma uncinatum TaxID=74035 RepID=UPI00144AF301|nr:uncharacterized protein GIQ15_04612 [Arthroderma uncinatum]KAF3481853.1 hypothetical protein GIQ15_04612 [Arthroderma uncinatum]
MATVIPLLPVPVEHPIVTGRSQCTTIPHEQPIPATAAPEVNKILPEAELEPKHPSYTLPTISLVDRYADEPRKIRVAVIGAGLSGLIAGVLLPAKVPSIELTIFEKNSDVGGAWFENVYPGVRCDIPAHVYQTSFETNTQWSEEYAQGAEIREYWTGIARKYEVYKYLKLSQRVEQLSWDNKRSIWLIKIQNLPTGEFYTNEADFVLTAIGRFNDWKLPNYPGLKDFKGLIRHASNWDPTFDVVGKRVAVIGNGSTGIQLATNIQSQVSRLDHYARSKTWIATDFIGDSTKLQSFPIPGETRSSFGDMNIYLKYRKGIEQNFWRGFDGWLKDSESNEHAREEYTQHLKKRLAKKPELVEAMIPEFSPHCRRLTPGPGYLEAITAENVDYIQTPIKCFTETGIITVDGKHREVDAIFAATGANIDAVPPFSITANGKDITKLWSEGGEYGFPYSYLGLATPGFPNLLFILGPNGAGRSGTVPHNVEVQVTLFARILRKVSREGIKTIQPSKKATDDFVQYSDAFWKTTVLSENCRSWYNGGKPGSRIHGLWPGSSSLVSIISNDPRWEDWEYEYLSDTNNCLVWYFGKGSTKMEKDPEYDITSYLVDPAEIDLRKLHEGRYQVVHKLGYGTYSTIWLTNDRQQGAYVAVKVSTADAPPHEAEILHALARSQPGHLGRAMIPTILDEFELQGPNGRHRCYVTAPVRSSVGAAKFCCCFAIEAARALIAQLVLAVAYTHAQGFIHGDIRLGNILLRLPSSFNQLSTDQLYENFGEPCKEGLVRLDGKPLSPNATAYATVPVWLGKQANLIPLCEAHLHLSDFGEGFPPATQQRPGGECHAPVPVLPPEALFEPEKPLSFPSDIWTLACAMWPIFGMRSLFDSTLATRDDIASQQVDVLGLSSFPSEWWNTWEARLKYFDEAGQPKDGQSAVQSLEFAFEEDIRLHDGKTAWTNSAGKRRRLS